jgi:hypothetical protein
MTHFGNVDRGLIGVLLGNHAFSAIVRNALLEVPYVLGAVLDNSDLCMARNTLWRGEGASGGEDGKDSA